MAAAPDRLTRELFLERPLYRQGGVNFRKYLPVSTYMPGIATDSSVPDDVVHQIRQAHEEVKREPRVGIFEERNYGKVPVHIDHKPPYLGVTEFDRRYEGGSKRIMANRVGINSGVRGRKAKRVAKHEFRHVRSEALLEYMDVGSRTGTLIMESYAEFGGMKAAPHERHEIITTTPYTPAIKFGMYADKFYKSDIDGSRGYAAFIRDIQKKKSAKQALDRLGDNIKTAIESGVRVRDVVEGHYQREIQEAKAAMPAI